MRSFTYTDNDVAATGTWGKKKDVIKNANKQRLPHRALSPTFHSYSDMLASDL